MYSTPNNGIPYCFKTTGVLLLSKCSICVLPNSRNQDTSLIRTHFHGPVVSTLDGLTLLYTSNQGYIYSGTPLIWTLLVPEESGEVCSFQGLKSTQTWYLGRKKVSCLEKCPHFRGVLIEGFHCYMSDCWW